MAFFPTNGEDLVKPAFEQGLALIFLFPLFPHSFECTHFLPYFFPHFISHILAEKCSYATSRDDSRKI